MTTTAKSQLRDPWYGCISQAVERRGEQYEMPYGVRTTDVKSGATRPNRHHEIYTELFWKKGDAFRLIV